MSNKLQKNMENNDPTTPNPDKQEAFLMVLPLTYINLKFDFKAWLESMLPYMKSKEIKQQIKDKIESLDEDYPDATNLNPDKQDWKEAFDYWLLNNQSVLSLPNWKQIIIGHVERYFIQPLQSQNEGLEKENKMLLEKLLRIDELNEALQKEVEQLKSDLNQDWKHEYDIACKEILSLQEQIKEAEAEISELRYEIRNNY